MGEGISPPKKMGVEIKDWSWEMGRKIGKMLQRGNEEEKKAEQRERNRNREGGRDECKERSGKCRNRFNGFITLP